MDVTGESKFVLALCLVAAAWLITAVGILGLREHHRAIAWRRSARRAQAVARFATGAGRRGRRTASARRQRLTAVVRCATVAPAAGTRRGRKRTRQVHIIRIVRRDQPQ